MKLKGLLAWFLTGILILSVVAGCATPAAQQAPAPQATTAPAPAPTQKPAEAPTAAPVPTKAAELPKVEWTFGTCEPSTKDWTVATAITFAENVAKRTNGKFTMKVTVGDELGVQRAQLPQVLSKGVIQLSFISQGQTGTFPHEAIFALPFLIGSKKGVLEDGLAIDAATRQITDREFEKMGFKTLFFFVMTPVQLISNKPIDDVSNLKGLKVRTWDDTTSNIVKNLGGVPVVLPVAEVYTAMQRGVVDAVLTGAPAMVSTTVYEHGKYLYMLNLAPACQHVPYNIQAFNALPAEYQQVLLEEGKVAEKLYQERQPNVEKEAIDLMKSKGVQVFEPSKEQMAKAREKVLPIWDAWAAQKPINQETYDAVKKAFGF
ncbi:MAG: TRAP transporter substrate-binding protein [Chloroflexota bacterium]